MRNCLTLAAVLGMLVAGAAQAQQAPPPEPFHIDLPTPPAGTGPYPAVMDVEPNFPAYTVYRPADLTKVKRPLPIIAFGNGGCLGMGNAYRPYLTQIASHGYLAIALGPPGDSAAIMRMAGANPGGPGAAAPGTAPPSAPAPGAAPPRIPASLMANMTKASQLTDAINWAIAENGRKGSKYYHRLATRKIAVMGQSCGGLQVMQVNGDPRITTSVMLNSGLFGDSMPGMPGGGAIPAGAAMGMGGMDTSKKPLSHIHSPVLYLIGGKSDVAYVPASTDWPLLPLTVPAVFASTDVGHGGTFGQPNGGRFAELTIDWLDWQLKGDKRGIGTFKGPNCTLCTDPKWEFRKRGIN